jgi:glyoxylase-like metal-dependent hydrolase (beta-lactamase superfamily II)
MAEDMNKIPESEVWQRVPGTKNVQMYPYFRKVDILSSNSYIISSDRYIVLIDPGGLKEQADLLLMEVDRLLLEKHRPVLVCLTHIHIDHCYQLMHHEGFLKRKGLSIMVQEAGAIALENSDRQATIADLVRQDLGELSIDCRLLTTDERESGQETPIDLDGHRCITCYEPIRMDDGRTICCQTIPLSDDDRMECIHTPGHSPDSICIRIGSLFITGDLTFATAPAIAGITGWNRDQLLDTIDKVMWLLESGEITIALPGHGRPIDVPALKKTLKYLKSDADGLSGIDKVSPEWMEQTAIYGQQLLGEVERLFTIIAGRLVYIAHVLDELEESGEADRLRGLINADIVDEILADFNQFSTDFRAGKYAPIHLTLKAGQIVGKLDRLFEGEVLSTVLDFSLIRRAGRLLQDYSSTFRGFKPVFRPEPADINGLTDVLYTALTVPPYREEDILDAENEQDFMRALILRIAYINPFEKTRIDIRHSDPIPPVLLDRDRFSDSLLFLLEKLAARGATGITFSTSSGVGTAVLDIACNGCKSGFDPKDMLFAVKQLQLSGGELTFTDEGDVHIARIIYPLAQKKSR